MAEVLPFPPLGEVFVGRDAVEKGLRVSWHPEADRLVLSVWRGERCACTVRLTVSDAARLAAALVDGLGELASASTTQRRESMGR